ncbi:helix-turn-helix domain-containing protein [Bradyrhizobium oligotrophicum]|uniref:helix-turn-helix domain-containing protein n=1 Tax=Bradyrhizobium oligotrophicum TaxID=44255 RepID=UPI003EBBF70B
MDMRRLVGRNVLRIRKSKEMTQEQLAEISGFSQQYISGLEKGQRNPTVVTIYELSIALDVDYLELLKPDAQSKRAKE